MAAAPAASVRDRFTEWGRPSLDRFRRWLLEHCEVTGTENFYFGEFPHDVASVRGTGATRYIQVGEKVMCVPKTCFLIDGGVSDRVFRLTARSACNERQQLAVFIAEEMAKGDESRFAPYFDVMPTAEEMRYYHPAYADNMTLHPDIDRWSEKYGFLKECYRTYAKGARRTAVTYEAVRLAYVWLVTRNFRMAGLPPPIDFANSEAKAVLNTRTVRYNFEGRETKKDDEVTAEFCLVATKDIDVGEEIYAPYGVEFKSPMASFYLYVFSLDSADRHSTTDFPTNYCAGLLPSEFEDPGLDADPIAINYYRFAKKHCHQLETGLAESECWMCWLACFFLTMVRALKAQPHPPKGPSKKILQRIQQ